MAKSSKCKICDRKAVDHKPEEVIVCLSGIGIDAEYTKDAGYKICRELGILKGMGNSSITFTDETVPIVADNQADIFFQKALTKVRTPKQFDEGTLDRIEGLDLPDEEIPIEE